MSFADYLCVDFKLTHPMYSIRFAPPLVISEDDLMKAVNIIKLSLQDLDNVCCPTLSACLVCSTSSQLDDIPGEVESEKGFKDTLSN